MDVDVGERGERKEITSLQLAGGEEIEETGLGAWEVRWTTFLHPSDGILPIVLGRHPPGRPDCPDQSGGT